MSPYMKLNRRLKKQEQQQGTISLTLKTVSYPQIAKKDAEISLLLFRCVSSKRGNVEIASLTLKLQLQIKRLRDL